MANKRSGIDSGAAGNGAARLRSRQQPTASGRHLTQAKGAVLVHIIGEGVGSGSPIGRLLRAAGYAAKLYPSSSEFIEAGVGRSGAIRQCIICDIELFGNIRARDPALPIILTSVHADVSRVVAAMRAGAFSVLAKPFDGHALIDVLEEALEVEPPRDHLTFPAELATRRALLTPRQRDIFDLSMRGLRTKEVARRLGLSYRTVEVHRAHILRRMATTSFSDMLQDMLRSAVGTPPWPAAPRQAGVIRSLHSSIT